jgi:predicted nucleic-acid-binding Zn-ribbon protein
MRASMTCPKCRARKIWRIEQFRTESDSTSGWLLHVVYGRQRMGNNEREVGVFDAYVCATCGLTEFYASQLQNLRHVPEEGVTYWDGDQLNQGPMR